MVKTLACFFLVAFVVCTAIIPSAEARKLVTNVESSGLAAYTPSGTNLGDYYVLQFQIPSELTTDNLELAILELRLDVSSIEKNGYVDEAPVLEVYALSAQFSGTLDPAEFAPQTSPIHH